MALSDSLMQMFMARNRPEPNMLGSGMANKAGVIADLNRKIKEAYLMGDTATADKLREMLRQVTQPAQTNQVPRI